MRFFGMRTTLGWVSLTLIFGQQIFLSRFLCNANNFRPTLETAMNLKHPKKIDQIRFFMGQIVFLQGGAGLGAPA